MAAAGKVSAWRAADVLKVLRMLGGKAVERNLIARSPASRVRAPRVEIGEPWILSAAEVEAAADAVPRRYRALVVLAAYSSLRWSEMRFSSPSCGSF